MTKHPNPTTDPRLRLMVAERTRGLTFRAIAREFGLSKTHVHRLLQGVAILAGPRAKATPMPRPEWELVPRGDGTHELRLIGPRREAKAQ